jgi:hypothetical protein
MTTPASGAISLADITGEAGIPATSIFPTAFYSLFAGVPASGPLSFSDFYNKSSASPISATAYSLSASGFSQSLNSTITCTGGKTIASITLVGGSASGRISPGSTGGASTVGNVNTPSSGNGSASATYRYTTNTGEYVEIIYEANWGIA